MRYTLKFDGACEPNPGEMGIGIVVYNENNKKILELSEKCGFGTNVKAEYQAIIRGLEELSKSYTGNLLVQGDSQLVIMQSSNEWKVKQNDIKPLYERVKELEGRFESVEYKWVRRDENKEADMLSTRSLDPRSRKRDEIKLQLSPGNSYDLVFDDDSSITSVRDEKYGRDVLRYYVKVVKKNGKKIQATYFETGAKRLIQSLDLRKPLNNKKIRIIPTKQQTWIEYLIEELGD